MGRQSSVELAKSSDKPSFATQHRGRILSSVFQRDTIVLLLKVLSKDNVHTELRKYVQSNIVVVASFYRQVDSASDLVERDLVDAMEATLFEGNVVIHPSLTRSG